MRTDRVCMAYEGCRGLGWMNDLTDDGSGATVYCDCPAGQELLAKDSAPAAATPTSAAADKDGGK